MFRSLRSRNALFFIAGFGAAFSVITVWRWIETNRQQTRNSSRKRVVAFGDSITQHGFNNDISGWVSRLADWWIRRVDFLNRGFSGYNSEYGVIAFNNVVVVENPDLVFIFFGANDAVDSSNDRHVSLPKFEQNLRSMLDECKKSLPSANVVIITPPPIWETALTAWNAEKGRPLDRTNDRAYEYGQICHKLAKEFSLPIVDAWQAMEGASIERAQYLSDGLHLSARGNDKLAEAIKTVIIKELPHWIPETMPMQLPTWDQINPSNPRVSFY